MNAPVRFYFDEQPRSSAWLVVREPQSWDYGAANEASAPARTEPEAVRDWKEVHQQLVKLRTDRAAHERELCRWLIAAERLGAHVRAGHASLAEYADRVVGLGARETEERLRVGRALRELPLLDAALASGKITWSAARELSRVATRETEERWLGWSSDRSSREIEKAVAGRRLGDDPLARSDPQHERHVLRFEVRAETMALFRDLQAAVRRDLGGGLAEIDDDTLLCARRFAPCATSQCELRSHRLLR